jgi:hypothetical protein
MWLLWLWLRLLLYLGWGLHMLWRRGRGKPRMNRPVSARGSWHRHMRWVPMRHRYTVRVCGVNERGPVNRPGRWATWLLWELWARLRKFRGGMTVDLNTLPPTYLVEVGHAEIRNMTLQESITLSDLALDELGVTSKSEGLPMSVLLLARDTGSRARCTFRMFRVALCNSSLCQKRS